ncbi:hypothetical protein BT69DRAFT_1333399 [Atractiella rhizophila]|nr:hypothetical protein BT69DRAFT_1333399 [Atractiella rhizophila]
MSLPPSPSTSRSNEPTPRVPQFSQPQPRIVTDSPRASIDSQSTSVPSRSASAAGNQGGKVVQASSNVQLGVSRKGRFNAISTLLLPPTQPQATLLSLLPTASSLGLPALPTLPSSLPPPSLPAGQKSTLTPSAKRSAPPPIVLRDLGKVVKTKEEFGSYLKGLEDGGLYAKWERMGGGKGKEKVEEEVEDEPEEPVHRFPRSESGLSAHSRRASMMDISLPSSPPVLTVDRFLGFSARSPTSSSSRPMRKEDLPSLDIVPPIYFSNDFNLADPQVWDAVTERPTSLSSSGFPFGGSPLAMLKTNSLTLADLASDQILQEKLSHYLTLLESHLSVEISIRSTSFFSALSSLKSLSSVSSYALDSLYLLREELGSLDSDIALKGMEVLEKRKERIRLERVEAALIEVGGVVDRMRETEGCAERGEWEEALNSIDALVEAMAPHPPSSSTAAADANGEKKLDLSRIKALSSIPDRLEELRYGIGRQLEGEVLSILERDFAELRRDWKRRKAEDGVVKKGRNPKNGGGTCICHFLPPASGRSRGSTGTVES